MRTSALSQYIYIYIHTIINMFVHVCLISFNKPIKSEDELQRCTKSFKQLLVER